MSRSATYVLAAIGVLGLAAGCGPKRPSGDASPQITALSEPASRSNSKPIAIRGTLVDAATHQPIQLAHVSYNMHVVTSDANGIFTFSNVPPNQTLFVVVAGYRRYSATWNPAQPQISLAPFEARGLYMPFNGLSDPSMLSAVDRLTNNTEINSIVLEVKTDDGEVSSQMATPAAFAAKAVVEGPDLNAFIQRMHSRGIYIIGRFVVFRDPDLVAAHPEYALRRTGDGKAYADEQGQRWIDAFRQEVWQYNLDLAEKAAQTGLDEIQFDYVRFPGTDQPIDYAEAMTQDNRVAAITGFLKRAEMRLRPYGVVIAADTFGLTTVVTDDSGIGQDITSLGAYIDYYCPMVYPSTWSDGSLGVSYPPADPYTIVHDSVQSAVKRLGGLPTVRVRPWLQAFDDYKRRQLDYTPDRVNVQKEATSKAGGLGWMLWNPGADYPSGIIGPRTNNASAVFGH